MTASPMDRALELAARGLGRVEPNPLVGAVVCGPDGNVVGEGWHARFGGPHAEVVALEQAGPAAAGGTLYVTLEPCCHHGKTPPCTEAVIRAGIRRVVAAMLDPFPQVAGRGVARLREVGINVELGEGETHARQLNAPFCKRVLEGLPWVHAKWAMTLDGRIAASTRRSKWISNEESRRLVHALRGRMDAILVGIGTVLEDDPLLTARPPGPRNPCRVVFDRRLRLPLDSRLAATTGDSPVLVVAAPPPNPAEVAQRARALRERGVSIWTPHDDDPLRALLRELARDRAPDAPAACSATNVLIEGGSTLFGAFHDAGLIDEYHVFLAPKILGGAAALSPIGGKGAASPSDAAALEILESRNVGGDLYLRARRRRS
jgi:diaminohydroxyphosphoribosylaminopyrimidine deaminase/5-amino-6-(5-phosphoribosylamino)uracil reductase